MSGPSEIRPPAIVVANRYMTSAPIDLEGLASELGIAVDLDADLPTDISGKILCRQRRGETDYSIEVNKRHSLNRKRFTLAHEIAHFMLHKNLLRSGITDNEMYRSELSDQREREANRLAAELLMPANLVRTAFRAGATAIAPLAAAFGTSEEAMRIRLRQLDLMP